MPRSPTLGAVLLALSLLACRDPVGAPEGAGVPSPAAPAEQRAPPPAQSPAATAEPVTAESPQGTADGAAAREGDVPAPAASAATLLREAVALDPTGPIPLSPAEETVVDPGATFRVELGAEIPDGRLVLLDAADAIVPASGTREVAATTRFTVSPAAPLVPGSRYVLRLDGARAREIEDAAGRAFAPVSLKVLVAGEPPKPEPKPAPRKKRARR